MSRYRLESNFKAAAARIIKEKYGEDVWFYKVNDGCIKGLPDLILCFFGRFVGIELKNGQTERKAHEALQDVTLKRIQRADGFGFKARRMEDIFDGLEKIREVI